MKKFTLFAVIFVLYIARAIAQVGINTDSSAPDSSAMLDVKSTNKGFLPPRMTSAQRNAIVNPADGLMVICTDCNTDGSSCLSIFLGGQWQNLGVTCTLPGSPVEGTHVVLNTQITWNWGTVTRATGYKWNTTNDYATATDMGTATTKTETGLITGNFYTRYVWAYNACGISLPTTLTSQASQIFSCGSPLTINHVADSVAPVTKTVVYGTVTNIPGEPLKCWITQNLGADHQATAVNDPTEASAGWYWQFNRMQGYKHDGTTRIPNTTWINSIIEASAWAAANDPCTIELGNGWRIPTWTEWVNLRQSGDNFNNWNGPWNSGLKLHGAGFLDFSNGSLVNRGSQGNYWSSINWSSDLAVDLYFSSGLCNTTTNKKAYGFTLRCINDGSVTYIAPAVSTSPVTIITQSSATGGGIVTSEGTAMVTARGVCWSTTSNPTTANSHTSDGSGAGTFTSNLTGLAAGTLYHIRAYASNSIGTAYGDDVTFSTLPTLPNVTTAAVTSITSGSASCGGDVTFDGNAIITAKGVCWSTSPNPSITDSYTTDGSGMGPFTSNLSGLAPATLYHVRAYATNTIWTSYGNEVTFTTFAVIPTLTTVMTTYTSTTATSGGNVTYDGGAAITARGVCWSTSPDPVVTDSHTTEAGTTGSFTSNITGLSPGTHYFVRSYATNSIGTAYGNEISFYTLSVPGVTTATSSNVTSTTATSGGNVTSDGGATIIARGVCWSTSTGPVVTGSHTTDAGTSGSYTSSITGLSPGTIYYVRGYATNSVGTGYGNEITFATPAAIPTLTTATPTNVTSTTATCGGNVAFDGGATITARGVCWSTSTCPVVTGNHTTDAGTTGSYTSSIDGLSPGTIYYVRAYATNSVGTGYGNEITFATPAAIPTLTTATPTNVTSTTATCGGNVASDGGATITARGVCWSTSSGPVVTDSHTADAGTTGSYTSSITGLSPGTLYYVRAYATNSVGTAYGNELTFTTLAVIPTLTTSSVTNVTSATAIGGGNVTSDGGATITARGVCWTTSTGPVITGSHTTDAGTTGSYTSSITGLTAGTLYYVRAYATNSAGTAYGNEVTFTTPAVIPTLTTAIPTNVTSTAATSGGNVTSDGGATITARGVCWSTSTAPVVTGSHTTDAGTTGSYTSSITGLSPATLYYVRAYATNSVGTAYGNEVTFTTLATLPSLTTSAVTNVSVFTATGGGNVTADGGATITARGVCWSTTSGPVATGNHTTDVGTIGSYTSSLTYLAVGTLYYVRAYATNSAGTAYGSEVTFTTLTLPSLTTATVTNISFNSATGGGNVTADGGTTITARGVCWGTSTGPVTSGSHTTDAGTTGSWTSSITGLTAGTLYYVRAYATNLVGTVYGNEVTFTTLSCGASFTINHQVSGGVAPVAKTVTYGTMTNVPGETAKCWITSNLGADHQATSISDNTEASAGWYWQFNRIQGFKQDGTTLTPAWTITSISETSNWTTANDPCVIELGTGWRLPTKTEWTNVDGSSGGNWTNWNGPWNSGLKLHGAGFLDFPNGALINRGSQGNYWSSISSSSGIAWDLNFNSGASQTLTNNMAYGFTVRCIRDN